MTDDGSLNRTAAPNSAIVCFTTLIWAGFLFVQAGLAATGDGLPSAVQEMIARGTAAARVENWGLAAKHFAKAHKLAPGSAELIYNLALAVDRSEGHPLSALGWFRAYLEAAPDAANARQVRERMVELDIQVEASAFELLEAAKRTASSLPSELRPPTYYSEIAVAEANGGDIARAKETANLIEHENWGGHTYREIARAQAASGDFPGAKLTANQSEGAWRLSSLSAVACMQVAAGDLVGAQATAQPVRRGYLGVNVNDTEGAAGGALVVAVEPRSGAHEQDMREGDVIVKVGRYDVGSSAELLERLAQTAAGEEVKLRVVRRGRRLKKEVKLMGWLDACRATLRRSATAGLSQEESITGSVDFARRELDEPAFRSGEFVDSLRTMDPPEMINASVAAANRLINGLKRFRALADRNRLGAVP